MLNCMHVVGICTDDEFVCVGSTAGLCSGDICQRLAGSSLLAVRKIGEFVILTQMSTNIILLFHNGIET